MAKGKQKVRFDELQLQRLDEDIDRSNKRKKKSVDTTEEEEYDLEEAGIQGELDGFSRRQSGDSKDVDENEAKGRQAREIKKKKVLGKGGLGIADDDDFGSGAEKTGWAEFENAEEDYDEPEIEFNENGLKFEPFHLKQEREDGYFDEDGNYVENRIDKDVHDAWLDSTEVVDEKTVLKLKQLEKARSKQNEEEDLSIVDILKMKQDLIQLMQPTENVTRALKRLGKTDNTSRAHSQLKGALGKRKMSPEVQKVFEKMTELANSLLDAGEHNIYSDPREQLLRDISAFRSTSSHKTTGSSEADEEDMFGDDEDEKPNQNREIPDSNSVDIQANSSSVPIPMEPAQDTTVEDTDSNQNDRTGNEVQHPQTSSQNSAQNDFILDSSTGYYFCTSRNMYYDPTSGLYGSPTDRKWYYYENGKYTEVPTEKSDNTKALEDMSTKELLAFLKAKNVDVSGVVEKSDLLNIARKMSTV